VSITDAQYQLLTSSDCHVSGCPSLNVKIKAISTQTAFAETISRVRNMWCLLSPEGLADQRRKKRFVRASEEQSPADGRLQPAVRYTPSPFTTTIRNNTVQTKAT
jgi:hypothetical protein